MPETGRRLSGLPGKPEMMSLILIVVVSYLIGSIPSSIIVGKLTRGIDVRDYGSGNAGGTNAFRVLGWKAGLVVSIFDVGKGVLATLVISGLRIDTLPIRNETLIMILAGISAVLGHTFTIFAGFKGGKGVATGAGMIIGLLPQAVGICIIVFALVLFTTGIVSLASIAAAVSLPIVVFLFAALRQIEIDTTLKIISLIIPLFIIYTHRANIGRLLRGEENTFPRLKLLRRRK